MSYELETALKFKFHAHKITKSGKKCLGKYKENISTSIWFVDVRRVL